MDRVAPLLGSFDTRVLIGSVVENSAGTMLVEVPTGAMSNVVADVVQLHARIPLSAADMVSLEQRKLDVGRTTMLAGAIVAGIGIGVAAALHAGELGRRQTAGRTAADQSNSDLAISFLGSPLDSRAVERKTAACSTQEAAQRIPAPLFVFGSVAGISHRLLGVFVAGNS